MNLINHILCCDWGTSSFRLRLVDASDYSVIAEHQSAEGVAGTFKSWQAAGSPDRFNFYAAKLKGAIEQLSLASSINLSDIPVLVSGMASSSIGMEEIPYAPLPFAADGSQASARIFPDFNGRGNPLVVVSGIKSDSDVMRGEEAQLIGLLNLAETSGSVGTNALFVFPGTHSKHIEVKDGLVSSFRTFMTGEIFNILSEHSILKDSITTGADLSEAGNLPAFRNGVEASGSSTLLNTLFTVRTNQLFGKFNKEQNAFYLSGLLIGTELRQLTSGSADNLVICCGKHLYNHYKVASEVLNLKEDNIFIKPELIDKATIAGQVRIFKAKTDYEQSGVFVG
ncbi:2-dehydro-3-deoxygalactonokinase [Daejeonella sp. JGW-45]|uniref:2-dehydro-3-deoxygalactonokinase n=1 Tax=Daejeonella sp. JGW-45 TaxID=3034148 RepID=UPI0023EB6D02|nr:2-dehydro-3-deoxygalactonokinase [Daejeonella sp. JGW-45]